MQHLSNRHFLHFDYEIIKTPKDTSGGKILRGLSH